MSSNKAKFMFLAGSDNNLSSSEQENNLSQSKELWEDS